MWTKSPVKHLHSINLTVLILLTVQDQTVQKWRNLLLKIAKMNRVLSHFLSLVY